jgi:glucans biosynthesis protein
MCEIDAYGIRRPHWPLVAETRRHASLFADSRLIAFSLDKEIDEQHELPPFRAPTKVTSPMPSLTPSRLLRIHNLLNDFGLKDRTRSRRAIGALLLFLATVPAAALAFGLSDVERRAQALAKAAYVKPESELPKELRQLKYEQYQNIRFKPEQAHWRGRGMPIELSFFHQGMAFDLPVKINEVSEDGVREIRYRPDAFDFGSNRIDPAKLKGLGYAGFRLHYPINSPKAKDEVLVFLGASFFRALGRDQVYGLSARGLAINTAELSGEEFPRFVEFWVVRPSTTAREFVIFALLDSPRVAGAYRFVVKPGSETSIDVRARLYPRDTNAKFGLAPLTSMYYFGENQPAAHEDYRPEVHDSDGLSVNAGNGEWIWRPLVNPKRLLVTSFAANNPGGFGLQQRDRQFSNYEELGTRYEKRPSAWVEPQGEWGAGRVELVQIPTPDETNDNIVAYWVPDKPLPAGQAYDLQYRVLWQKDSEQRPPLLWVMQTRRGPGFVRKPEKDSNIPLLVDFAGAAPPARESDGDGIMRAPISIDGNGEVVQSKLERNGAIGGWRLSLTLRRVDQSKPVEVRAHLTRDNRQISETWSYILPPE